MFLTFSSSHKGNKFLRSSGLCFSSLNMSLSSSFHFFSFHLQRPEIERNRRTRKGAPCARPPIFHISTTFVTITRLNLDCGSQPASEFEHHWTPRFLLVKKRKVNVRAERVCYCIHTSSLPRPATNACQKRGSRNPRGGCRACNTRNSANFVVIAVA